jgi:hypothetical protein
MHCSKKGLLFDHRVGNGQDRIGNGRLNRLCSLEIDASLDYFVREGDEVWRNRQTERFCSFKIDHEFVFGWRLYR